MERKINPTIFFRPIGNRDTASSRLRVWNIQPHIEDSVVAIANEYRKGDTLIIQKVPDINELRKAKSQGAKVIYDIDDCYWKENHVYDNWQDYLQMIKECDVLTVDTEAKKKLITEKEAIVIPDSLDWDGTEKKDGQKGIIGWTGYGNNSVYLNDIKGIIPEEFKIRLIVDPSWIHYIKAPALNVQNRPWSQEMVDKYLAECEFGIYYLPEREFEQVKGEHKLLKNWAIGLPTYTSRIPSYVKAMKEAGVGEKYLVDDWTKLKNIGFDKKLKDYALKFKAEKIATLWEKTISQLSTPTTDKKKE
jgi:hypothetical protein